MNHNRGIFDLEVKPVIFCSIAVKHSTITLDPAKSLAIELIEVLPTHFELIQELQLFKRP